MQKFNAADKFLMFTLVVLFLGLMFFVEMPENNVEVVQVLSNSLVEAVKSRK